jgi:segregation and condensation protein B
MSKRKKTSEHDARGVVSDPVDREVTGTDLAGPAPEGEAAPHDAKRHDEEPFGGPEPDTQVGPPPTDLAEEGELAQPSDESWDGPTNVGTEDELAELAAASISHGEQVAREEANLGAGEGAADQASAETAVAPGEDAAPEPPPAVAPGRLASIIESLLFASDRPLAVAELKRLLGERDTGKMSAALEDLHARRAESGVQVVQVAGGWHLRTNPENVAWVSRILSGKPPRLSRAMLETLAIVAYRQPITRPEIDEIRGVDCGPVLKTLLERNLVRMIGKKEEVGRPILYGTTPEFLRTFSLRDLTELPTLREFHELGEAEKAKVDAVAPAAASADVPAPPRPVPLREPDPEEEDQLLSELDRANAAATKATAPPPEADPAPDVGADDKTVG